MKSRAYRRAKRLVGATIERPSRLRDLANMAQKKAAKLAQTKLAGIIEPIRSSYRLIRAYANGTYRDISLENFGLIVAAIIYFVMPIDALPDFIVGLGFTDDAAILIWTFSKVSEELTRFADWEAEHKNQHDEQQPPAIEK
ncbi:MAG: uncharacterized membrane protein YkvA (DUF1232 family) [Arenicella sp.]|jgi:uncharacterized membrane protein YkvA (DUF1232 family)